MGGNLTRSMTLDGVLIPLFHGDFGGYLVSQRRAAGWSQEELAERSTVSVRTIRNLETGAIKSPRKSSVDLLLGAFGSTRALQRVRTFTPPIWTNGRAESLAATQEEPAVTGPHWWGTREEPDAIVGRASDLARIRGSLHGERCIVLTGPPGAGKTRLALAAAHQMREAYRDGVAIAEAGGLPREGADPREDLERLRRLVLAEINLSGGIRAEPLPADSHLLLVIDNVEHITTATTVLARQILAACPGIHLIITSRRPVCAPSAPVWDVGPLSVGDNGSDAVELFLRRTGAACPALDLAGSLGAVRELCEKLDGIPFALELAASRLRSVSLDTLLRDGAITHLLGQARSADLPHHRNLADSVRWSYDMLTGNQRVLLDRLASFPAAFTIEDVERLYRGSGARAPEVGLLAELVDSSLVHVERGARYSYRLFGYVREFVRNWSDAIPMQGCDQPSHIS